MNESIADLMAAHGDKVEAVRRRTLELSKLPHEEVVAIEAALKNPKDFPSLDGDRYINVSLEGTVTDSLPPAPHVLRFLAGYKFDVERAALHLLREQRWRLVDDVAATRVKACRVGLERVIPINIRAAAPQTCHLGVSRDGHIITMTRVGFTKPKALMRSITADDYIKYCFEANEIICHNMDVNGQKTGRLMGVVQVLDLAGFGTKHMDRAFINGYLRTAIAWASERYVEMVYRTLIINAPWVFSALWSVAKTFLNEAQREKVRVCTAGAKSEAELLRYVNKDTLPNFMYGERVVPYLEPEFALKTKMELERPEIRPRLTRFFRDAGVPEKAATIDALIAEVESDSAGTFDKLIERLEYDYRRSGAKVPPLSKNLARIDLDAVLAEVAASEAVDATEADAGSAERVPAAAAD